MSRQRTLFTRSEMDALECSWRHLEWKSLPETDQHLVGRCEHLGAAVARGAHLTHEARQLVAAAQAAGLLGWLRQPSQEALEQLLGDS